MFAHLVVATQAHSYVLCLSAFFYSARYACVEVILSFIDNGAKGKYTDIVVYTDGRGLVGWQKEERLWSLQVK